MVDRRHKLKALGLLGGGAAAPAVTYILRDDFTTTEASPMATPRTCEPGPGSWVVDTGPAISGGKLILLGNGSYRGVIGATGLAQIPGRSIFLTRQDNGSILTYEGFCNAAKNRYQAFRSNFGELDAFSDTAGNVGGTITPNVDMLVGVIQQTNGYYLIVSGGSYAQWTLLWPSIANPDSWQTNAVYPYIVEHTNALTLTVDNVRVVDLQSVFTTDYSLTTARTASASANATLTHVANCFIEGTRTFVTNDVYELSFRMVDADNRWIVRCDQANSKVYLYERNAGVETERGATGGIAQTFTNGTSHRIVAMMDGQAIWIYVDGVRKIAYATATFNLTATGGMTNLAVTNFMTHQRQLTGAALAEVQRCYPF